MRVQIGDHCVLEEHQAGEPWCSMHTTYTYHLRPYWPVCNIYYPRHCDPNIVGSRRGVI